MSTIGMPRFSDGEMKRRLDAVLALMDREGLDALLVFGHSGARRHYQADVHYLTNVAPFHECYLLVPQRGDPVLHTTHYNHLASARENSFIPDVRRSGRKPAGEIAEDIEKRISPTARVGLVGTMFYGDVNELRAKLPEANWRDVTLAYKMVRAIKSPEELDFTRRAAAACDAVMNEIAGEIRPGLEERDILVLSEEVAWKSGCEPYFLYLNSTPMAASESCVPNQNISRRKLESGDVVNTELSVSYNFYNGQILRPFFLGEPTAEYGRLYSVAKQVRDDIVSLLKPGATARDVWEATAPIEAAGYTTVDGMLHGFGVDIMPPSVRSTNFPAPADFTFQENMLAVVQPNPTAKDERAGVQLGELGVVTATGFEPLHTIPSEVYRIGR
jgi:Xaa-Pro aminopeptidase